MPHAHFECEGVIVVHSAQLFHERHHVRHRVAGMPSTLMNFPLPASAKPGIVPGLIP
jgi:hypothetical protein